MEQIAKAFAKCTHHSSCNRARRSTVSATMSLCWPAVSLGQGFVCIKIGKMVDRAPHAYRKGMGFVSCCSLHQLAVFFLVGADTESSIIWISNSRFWHITLPFSTWDFVFPTAVLTGNLGICSFISTKSGGHNVEAALVLSIVSWQQVA